MNKFKGTGVALITPFNEDGKVDFSGLQKLVDFQIKNNINLVEYKKFVFDSSCKNIIFRE